MNELRIIGIGSPFADDNIAELVIKKLKHLQLHYSQLENVTIEYHDRPHLQIMQLIKEAKRVIFIDALLMDEDSDIGKVYHFTATDILNLNSQGLMTNINSSHAMGLVFCLQLAESLGELPDETIVLGITVLTDDLQLLTSDEGNLFDIDYYANAIDECVKMAINLL